MYRIRELEGTNHVKGMLLFNGSCWCCVNSKNLFACQNAATLICRVTGWSSGIFSKPIFIHYDRAQSDSIRCLFQSLSILKHFFSLWFVVDFICVYSFVVSICYCTVWLMTYQLYSIVLISQWLHHHVTCFLIFACAIPMFDAEISIFMHRSSCSLDFNGFHMISP